MIELKDLVRDPKGTVTIYRAPNGAYNFMKSVTSYASRTGAKIKSRWLLGVDPNTKEAMDLVEVTVIEQGRPNQRPRKEE